MNTIDIQGADGAIYRLLAWTNFARPRAVPGIYAFVHESAQGGRHVLYAGSTGELATRLANHEKWPAAEKLGANAVYFSEARTEADALRWEADIVSSINPLLNVQLRSRPIGQDAAALIRKLMIGK